MRNRTGAAALIVLPMLLASLLVAPGADAGGQAWSYSDPNDAGLYIDVERTTLDVFEPGRIRVRVLGREFVEDSTDVVRIFVDTRRADTGPEYWVTWYLGQNPASPKGTAYVTRSDSWNSDGQFVNCPGLRRAVDFRVDIIRISVPRACLNRPEQVRWAGFVGRITHVDDRGFFWGYWDYFPSRYTFNPEWVA